MEIFVLNQNREIFTKKAIDNFLKQLKHCSQTRAPHYTGCVSSVNTEVKSSLKMGLKIKFRPNK